MGWVVNATPRPLYSRERPSTHGTGDWVGSRPGPEVRKTSPPPGLKPRTAQPVTSRYIDCAIPTHVVHYVQPKFKTHILLFVAEVHYLLKENRSAIIYALGCSKLHTQQPRGFDIFEIRRQACFAQLMSP
jgi:hypothetical protein